MKFPTLPLLACLALEGCSQAAVKPPAPRVADGGLGGSPGAPTAGTGVSPVAGTGGVAGFPGPVGTGGTGGSASTPGAGGGPLADARPMVVNPPPRPSASPPPGDAGARPDAGAGNRPDAAPPNGQELLYVFGAAGMAVSDMELIAHLTGRGFRVSTRSDTGVTASDAVGKAALLISSSTAAANIIASLPTAPILATPIVLMEQNLEPFLNMTGAADDEHNTTEGTEVEIGGDEELTGDLEDTVTVYNMPFEIGWGVPGEDALIGATVDGEDGQVAIYAYESGDDMLNNSTAPANRAFFFLRDSPTANILTADGLRLFDAVVDFATDR